ncbi:hypothetical protein NE540_24885, partial [Phocaeicola vulgatus]|uniref:hypothetical protein n=1 Tax=Phocaeicola vulgatus TaxID=821 RepID=UPI00210A84F7
AKLGSLPHPHSCGYIILCKNERTKGDCDKQGLEEDKRSMQGRAEMEESMTEQRNWRGEKGEM